MNSIIPSAKYIDNGFYRIAPSVAGKLVRAVGGNKLPRHGYERLMDYKGHKLILSRTRLWGAMVWSVRERNDLTQ